VAETVRLLGPADIRRNKENPRLIFRQEELDTLQDSIAKQGILVPLTVYQDGDHYFLLDGERRWLSALKLGLTKVPVIVQPKPERMQNIMMMFAIHNARKDWDPLPTALKLEDLEKQYAKRYGKPPTESELAGIASLSRGEVRRLKKLLALPREYRTLLLDELEKPRSAQVITVDHVLEATKGAEALRKRGAIDAQTESDLRGAIIEKFRTGVVDNTVAPRQLVRLARSVERGEMSAVEVRRTVKRLIDDPHYSINEAFKETVEQPDFEHSLEQLIERLTGKIAEHEVRGYAASDTLRQALSELARRIRALLK
jgi:ParB family transcriptional regulator, chromosome partitioning protein